MTRKFGLLVPILAVSIVLCAHAEAQDATAPTNAQQPKVFEGGVQKVDLSLERLRDVGLDLKNIMTNSRHLYDEVTIQPVQVITQPEVVGRGIVVNIPIGTVPTGPAQQPRKERVDLAMNNITPIIQLFKKNADGFVSGEKELNLSDTAKLQLQPLMADWIANVQKISAELSQLQSLTQGPVYDNASIAAVCGEMQKTAQALDKTRSQAFKILKKLKKVER